MKLIPILASAFVSVQVFAAPAPRFDFRCINSEPTTSFILRTEGDQAVLTTIHHNGTGYMPIHEGIVVPKDLPNLQTIAEHLTKTGNVNEFRFPLAKCQKSPDGKLMSCIEGETKTLGGEEFTASSLNVSKIVETTMYGTFEKTRITLSLKVPALYQYEDIVNDFYDDDCHFAN